jgi:sarcosine oxidase subunit alpha
MPRAVPLRNAVTISLDGESIEAEHGEPIAAALLAAGKSSFARSPKFHRPRGPACMRAACDGCLARVDGVPNVMTCMTEAREGTRVEVQNTLGSREIDLLRVTDWFFPEGMDHHRLFAGVLGVQGVMQAFARRVAGLGLLPETVGAARPARRRALDVVVVGAGPAGMAVASRLVERGRAVEIVDDALAPGGGLRALGARDACAWGEIEGAFANAVKKGLVVRPGTTAGGLYGDDLLLVGREGAEIVSARALVLATGAHDGVLAFEGNDVPGVMSARAAGILLRGGVLVGRRVVVVVARGGGPFGAAYTRAIADAAAPCEVVVVEGEPVRVTGSSAIRSVTVRDGGAERKLKADALLVDAPRSPAYELVEQAGAKLVHEPRGFVPRVTGGKIREGVWVAGEAAGASFDPVELARAAEEVAAQIAL